MDFQWLHMIYVTWKNGMGKIFFEMTDFLENVLKRIFFSQILDLK